MDQQRHQQLIDEIISYFNTELEIEIGTIAAEGIIDFIGQKIKNQSYNQALIDSQKIIREGMESIIANIDIQSK